MSILSTHNDHEYPAHIEWAYRSTKEGRVWKSATTTMATQCTVTLFLCCLLGSVSLVYGQTLGELNACSAVAYLPRP